MNAETMTSNEKRALLRKAIAAHPAWESYRIDRNLPAVSGLSGLGQCLEVCEALGIDAQAILDGETRQTDAKAADEAADETWRKADVRPVETKPQAPDAEAALAALRALLGGGAVDPAQVKALVEAEVTALHKRIDGIEHPTPDVVVIDADGKERGKIEGLKHKMAGTLLKACSARDTSGRPVNVWLTGPSQSGKTTAAAQAAKALGVPFAFHGAMEMSHELVGFVDGAGRYHETHFVRHYRDGGLVLLDEVDAGSDEARLALNAALANGHMSLPNGQMIERHRDFYCLAAANTYGTGPTADYIGRAKIDGAFLQRFPVKLFWDYDEKLEREMSGNPDFAIRVQKARFAASKAGLKVLITPAHSKAGAALIAAGFSEDEAASMTYLAGLTKDQIKIVEAKS